MAGYCEQDSKLSDSIRDGQFLGEVSASPTGQGSQRLPHIQRHSSFVDLRAASYKLGNLLKKKLWEDSPTSLT